MKFRVGPYEYRARIADVVRDDSGNEGLGLAVYENREVLISSRVRPEHRLEVLLHELLHCWCFHFPEPQDQEQLANFTAVVMQSAMEDLDRQGGVVALMRLGEQPRAIARVDKPREIDLGAGRRVVPADCVDASETPAMSRAGRAQCGVCEMIVSDGSIVTGKPEWSQLARGMVVRRTLHCCHCDHLQTWVEGCTWAGNPNGAVVEEPTYQRGEAVDEFLRLHPEAVGMLVE